MNDKKVNYSKEDKTKIWSLKNKIRKKIILAIDTGSITGWAIKDEFGVRSGSTSFKQHSFVGKGLGQLHFQQWLNTLPSISIVYFREIQNYPGIAKENSYDGCVRTLINWCKKFSINCQAIPDGIIKKHISDIKNPEKLGLYLGYDDELEAIELLHLATQRKNQLKKK